MKTRSYHSTLLVLLFCLAPGAGVADPGAAAMPVPWSALAALSAPPAEGELVYGPAPQQTVLRYEPASPRANLVMIHGGCWSADYDRGHVLPLAAALRDVGYRVWVPEYRRVGDPGGGWPGTWADIEAALNVVAVAIPDNEPLLVAGHSAGGHLALLAAVSGLPEVDGVVGLAAITDLATYGAAEGSCQAMVAKLMGGGPDARPDSYRVASPAGRALLVPVALVHGTADPIVALQQSSIIAEAEAAASGGQPVTLFPVAEAGHFDLVHPGTAAFSILRQALASLHP